MLSEARKRAKDRGENMMNDEVNAIMAPLNDLKVSFKTPHGLTTQNDGAVERALFKTSLV